MSAGTLFCRRMRRPPTSKISIANSTIGTSRSQATIPAPATFVEQSVDLSGHPVEPGEDPARFRAGLLRVPAVGRHVVHVRDRKAEGVPEFVAEPAGSFAEAAGSIAEAAGSVAEAAGSVADATGPFSDE